MVIKIRTIMLLVWLLALIMLNINGIATNLKNDVEMKLIIDSKASIEEEQAMIADLKANKKIETVLYSSKEEELAKVIKDYGDEFALQEQNNPLNNTVYIKAKNPQETASLAKEMKKYTLITDLCKSEKSTRHRFFSKRDGKVYFNYRSTFWQRENRKTIYSCK